MSLPASPTRPVTPAMEQAAEVRPSVSATANVAAQPASAPAPLSWKIAPLRSLPCSPVAQLKTAPQRFWMWPHLLSLDAPLIAMLWQALFAASYLGNENAVGWAPVASLGMAVWVVYAADRTLDAWRGLGPRARHDFYRRRWRALAPAWLMAIAAGAWMAWTALPGEVLRNGGFMTVAVALYMGTVHLKPGWFRAAGSKEAAVAVVFALGTSLIVWPTLGSVIDVLPIALFAALCWINCVAIEDWETGRPLRELTVIVAGSIGILAVLLLRSDYALLAIGEVLSALALLALDTWFRRAGCRVSGNAKRVLADVALLSPMLLFPLSGWLR